MAKNILKEKLDSHGLSQSSLVKETGISISTINKVCSNKTTPSPRTVNKIVLGLNVLSESNYTVSDIFK